MELKKNPESDLERRRTFFFYIGLVTSLAIVLVAFEWKLYEVSVSELGKLKVDQEEEEMIPITRQDLTPPPPPAPKPTQIDIVKDEVEVKEDVQIQSETTEEMVVEIKQQEEVVEDIPIFTVVEEMPSLPACDKISDFDKRHECTQGEIQKFIVQNTKYPQMAKEAGITGTVYVNFEINNKGDLTDVKLLKGIGGGCDEEAMRVVKLLPKFAPGKQRGRPVRVSYNVPIRFTLK